MSIIKSVKSGAASSVGEAAFGLAEKVVSSLGGGSDGGAHYFLEINAAKAGKILGDSCHREHPGAIVVHSWSWGVSGSPGPKDKAGKETVRRSYEDLVFSKRLDRASTSLMNLLSKNDALKEAKLAMRHSTGDEGGHKYCEITLQNARVSSIDLDGDEQGETIERVCISYKKVNIVFSPPKNLTSVKAGASTFEDTIEDANDENGEDD